jgi:hypothetical protein
MESALLLVSRAFDYPLALALGLIVVGFLLTSDP